MAAFYYGSCPWDDLVWKCACDGSDIEIWPFDTLQTNKNLEYIWALIKDSTGYGGEWRDRILQATIDLQVTNVTEYGESGAIVPCSVSTVPFRQLIKLLHDGVSVAEYYLPDGTCRFFTRELSREQRIKKFLNNAVPYIWKQVQKIKSDRVFDKRMTDNHEPKIISEMIRKDDVETFYLDTIKVIKNRDNDFVNHPSHYKTRSGMEVIDIIEAVICDLPGDEAYAIGNAIKYICRYRNNGKPIQDLEMAKLYINRAIENYKKGEKGD